MGLIELRGNGLGIKEVEAQFHLGAAHEGLASVYAGMTRSKRRTVETTERLY
jgi:hypothetical protein